MALDPADARRRMVAPRHCASQAELLTYFDLPIALLQTRPALEQAASELVEMLSADGVTYAEIRWAPRLHQGRGLGIGEIIEAVASGCRRAADRLGAGAPVIGLIVTAMRSHPPGANVLLAREAARFGWPCVGFDLAGLEAEWPAPPHAAAFVAAAEGGLRLTAHAGEVAGPEHVREVLEFGVSRIAHGVTAADDEELLARIKERDVTLDLCPSSNVQAGIVQDLAGHPLARLHRSGVSVTCSTDDRVVSATTLSDELADLSAVHRLSPSELTSLAVNAFQRAFAPAQVIRPLLNTADAAWQRWASEATGAIS